MSLLLLLRWSGGGGVVSCLVPCDVAFCGLCGRLPAQSTTNSYLFIVLRSHEKSTQKRSRIESSSQPSSSQQKQRSCPHTKMPHSITGKHRSKRPDSRPNAKKRKKQKDDAYAAAEAKDIISTRIPKSQQKERPVTGQLRTAYPELKMKRVKFLQKLLRQIENLKERKEGGEKLEEAQLMKLGRLDEVVAEIEEMLDVNLDSSDDEDDKDDDNSDDDDDDEEDEISKGSDDQNEEEKQLPMKR